MSAGDRRPGADDRAADTAGHPILVDVHPRTPIPEGDRQVLQAAVASRSRATGAATPNWVRRGLLDGIGDPSTPIAPRG